MRWICFFAQSLLTSGTSDTHMHLSMHVHSSCMIKYIIFTFSFLHTIWYRIAEACCFWKNKIKLNNQKKGKNLQSTLNLFHNLFIIFSFIEKEKTFHLSHFILSLSLLYEILIREPFRIPVKNSITFSLLYRKWINFNYIYSNRTLEHSHCSFMYAFSMVKLY